MSVRQGEAGRLLGAMFAAADIRFDGARPFDITVHDERFYTRVIRDGVLGFGDSYVEGWWDCDSVDQLIARLVSANLQHEIARNVRFLLYALRVRLRGVGSRARAFEVGQRHYDLGNALFEAMLDERMIYSCGYWKGGGSLDESQARKLDLVCRKLDLRPGMRVLEIGCGWGGWAKYAASNYGVEVVGLTVSKEQAQLARLSCANLPVEIRLEDYRSATGVFDRVVSIAMFEAVGQRYHDTFMGVVDRCLAKDGRFLLHSIVANRPVRAEQGTWVNERIFPNGGDLPSLGQIFKAAEPHFVVEAAHRFADDYDRTLAAWHSNFVRNWDRLRPSYPESFFRLWHFYLMMARGLFQARYISVWQIAFSKNGAPYGFASLSEAESAFSDIR